MCFPGTISLTLFNAAILLRFWPGTINKLSIDIIQINLKRPSSNVFFQGPEINLKGSQIICYRLIITYTAKSWQEFNQPFPLSPDSLCNINVSGFFSTDRNHHVLLDVLRDPLAWDNLICPCYAHVLSLSGWLIVWNLIQRSSFFLP